MVATLAVAAAEKVALAKAPNPDMDRNLLKALLHYASMHPKAVTDYLVDMKQTEPHTEGTTPRV